MYRSISLKKASFRSRDIFSRGKNWKIVKIINIYRKTAKISSGTERHLKIVISSQFELSSLFGLCGLDLMRIVAKR